MIQKIRIRLSHQLKRLEVVLHHFRFCGKVSQAQDLALMRRLVFQIQRLLKIIIQVEDHQIFPYLVKHIPKLEHLTDFLKNEHQYCKREIRDFSLLLKQFSQSKSLLHRSALTSEIETRGGFLLGLLGGHLGIEEKNIYEAVGRMLKPDEKKEIKRFLAMPIHR